MAYARARPKTKEIATADDAASFVIKDFRANGSPTYSGKRIKTIKTASGRDAVIYHFSGDQWGNCEAVAYYVETKTINFVTLTSRTPKAFEDALPAFEKLAASYIYMGDAPITDTEPQASTEPETGKKVDQTPLTVGSAPLSGQFEDVQTRAKALGETEEGKVYEKRFSVEFAKPLQSALQDCARGTKPPYPVHIVFVIAADGTAKDVLAAPDQPVSVCVAKKLTGLKLPEPPKPDWLVSVSITVRQ